MATAPKIDGRNWREGLTALRKSTRQIRATIGLINELLQGGRVSQQTVATMLVEILLELTRLEGAADAIEAIAGKSKCPPGG